MEGSAILTKSCLRKYHLCAVDTPRSCNKKLLLYAFLEVSTAALCRIQPQDEVSYFLKIKYGKTYRTGSDWDGVNFLPDCAVFWICNLNSADNTPVFWHC